MQEASSTSAASTNKIASQATQERTQNARTSPAIRCGTGATGGGCGEDERDRGVSSAAAEDGSYEVEASAVVCEPSRFSGVWPLMERVKSASSRMIDSRCDEGLAGGLACAVCCDDGADSSFAGAAAVSTSIGAADEDAVERSADAERERLRGKHALALSESAKPVTCAWRACWNRWARP